MICNCKEVQEQYQDCTVCSNGSKIPVEENKRKYVLSNSSSREVCRVRIDGCLIQNQDRAKCDFMIIICNTEDVYFIELKGKDLIRAVEQLFQTIEDFRSEITGKIFARAVVSKVSMPKSIEVDARVIKLRKILRKYGGNFDYSSRLYEKDRV